MWDESHYVICVYLSLVESGSCSTYIVDDRPNEVANGTVEPEFRGVMIENRSNQKLGASVATNDKGVIATCAPLYVNYSPRGLKREPTGDCWISKDMGSRFIRSSPCVKEFTQFYWKAYPTASTDTGWVSWKRAARGTPFTWEESRFVRCGDQCEGQ